MNRTKIILIVLASVVVAAVAGAAIMAGIIESERSAKARKTGSTPRPTAVASLQVIRPTGVPGTAVPSPVPAPTFAPSVPVPEPTAYAPEVVQTVQAPPEEVVPPAPLLQCPSGVVSGGLTDITLTPAPQYGVNYVAVTGRGVIHNATDSKLTFFDGDIPDVQGLNARGETKILLTLGTFDYVPPAGQPRPGTLSLNPGESMGYSVSSPREYESAVLEVQSFYSAMDRYDIYYSGWSNHRDCGNPPRQDLPGGQSLANGYVPAP